MLKSRIRPFLIVLAIWIMATSLIDKSTVLKIKALETTVSVTKPPVLMKIATPINSVGRYQTRIYHSN
jgi:hypothetical protein